MNIFSYIIIVFGFIFILLGFIIWKRQKLAYTFDSNSKNVKNEDLKEYTESYGKAYIIMGFSLLLLVISEIKDNNYSIIVFILWLITFIYSMVKIIKIQKKYKTGIFN